MDVPDTNQASGLGAQSDQTAAKVVSERPHFNLSGATGAKADEAAEPIYRKVENVSPVESPTALATFQDLHPQPVPELDAAIRLLARAVGDLNAAEDALQRDDVVGAHDALQAVIVRLREAFCFRSIGDGFASIVNAALAGLENLTTPPTVRIITALRRRIDLLISQPFLTVDEAVEHVMALEGAGLAVEPEGFNVLEDWLANEGLRGHDGSDQLPSKERS